MNVEEFEKLYKDFEEHERSLLLTKRSEYAMSDDCLSNFKATAASAGMTPEEVCIVLMMKHVQAICKMGRDKSVRLGWGGNGAIEGASQRISDARNYLMLLAALIEERSASPKNETEWAENSLGELLSNPALSEKKKSAIRIFLERGSR
jgi:hypothetical protein